MAKAKPPYHHGDLRRTLLDASLALLEEQGLSALSLREVARRAGVTHGAPYHHFEDRGALLFALVDEGFGLLLTAMRAEQAATPERPEEQLSAAGRGYVRFALAHPVHFRLMFRPELSGDKTAQSEAGQAAYALLVDSVTACQKAGLAPAGSIELLVVTAWSLVHGFASLWLDGPLSAPDASGIARNPDKIAKGVTSLIGRLFADAGAARQRAAAGKRASRSS